jgi:predicted permease
MENFWITFEAVAKMLAFAAPAFLLMRFKKFDEKSISTFVTLLLFIGQPCLTVYSFQKATQLVADGVVSGREMAVRGLWAFLLSLGLQCVLLGVAFLLLRKKQEKVENRIFVIAATFGNSGFFGTPILEAVMGDTHPDVVMVAALYSLVMNMLCWTVVSAIITRDRKYISIKKIFVNPNTVAGAIALLLISLTVVLPKPVNAIISQLGGFSTPLCMFILGMRLALVKGRELFGNWRQYAVVLCKNFVYPLLAFCVLYFVPVEPYIKQALFIICCCPIANMVLSFAELLGKGQKTAANVVLLSTISSLLTLPVMCLMLPLLA